MYCVALAVKCLEVFINTVNLIIHIGPPKTGTSAIQKWLKDNIEFLRTHGIYYPQHTEDSNGISSGNFLSVFDPLKGDYKLNLQRIEALKNKTAENNCHTLLLSSEFFFHRLLPLVNKLPNVSCIAYVRNPAELHESHYNQSVKRHGNVATIKRADSLPMNTLKVLGDYASKLGERLILRAYHEDLFLNNSIVSDFLTAINLPADEVANINCTKRINTSYTLEALEVKRWFNRYELGNNSNPLDRILQSYSNGVTRFTFVGKHQFNDYKRQSLKWLGQLYEQAPFANGDKLLKAVHDQEHQNFYKQEISMAQCDSVLRYIASENMALLTNLALCVYAQPNIEDKAPFTNALFKLVPPSAAVPNMLQYTRRAFVNSYSYKFVGCDDSNCKQDTSKFRVGVNRLLKKQFSLVAYLKVRFLLLSLKAQSS